MCLRTRGIKWNSTHVSLLRKLWRNQLSHVCCVVNLRCNRHGRKIVSVRVENVFHSWELLGMCLLLTSTKDLDSHPVKKIMFSQSAKAQHELIDGDTKEREADEQGANVGNDVVKCECRQLWSHEVRSNNAWFQRITQTAFNSISQSSWLECTRREKMRVWHVMDAREALFRSIGTHQV